MSQSVTGIVKPGYSPHEQYSSDSRLQGPWSDFYALGGTLYRAIAGRPPEEATLRVDVDRMPPAAQVAKGRYRPDFLEGIDACLKVKQAERPQSVAQLKPMLLGPQAAGNARPVARRRFAAAAAILLAVGVAYGGLQYTRWAPAERGANSLPTDREMRRGTRSSAPRSRTGEAERGGGSETAKRRADLDADRRGMKTSALLRKPRPAARRLQTPRNAMQNRKPQDGGRKTRNAPPPSRKKKRRQANASR
jgi:hypothetical protein